MTVQEVAKKAAEAGMSYGQYVDAYKEMPEMKEVPPPPDKTVKVCPVCGKEFWVTRRQNRMTYCSGECKAKKKRSDKVKKEGPKIEIGDQTAKSDAGKPRLSLVPPQIMYQIAAVREYGTAKYGDDPENWKYVELDRLWDACLRHITAAWENYTARDPDSGLMHISHAACNLAFLLQAIKEWEA